jgi:beta-N-acetylhexosaminidase
MSIKSSELDLGLNFVVGLSGVTLSGPERTLLSKLRPSGIIIFKHNISRNNDDLWIPALVELIADVKSCIARDRIIISVDHEGGLVHRFPEPVTRFCTAAQYQKKSFDVAVAMAKELRALSFNTTYSPVLDIHTCEANPVIGKRAFGTSCQEVVDFSAEYLTGLNQVGIIACGKHFPGHGDTTVDSHFSLPVLDIEKEDLSKRELVPFKAAINSNIPMLMTAHVMYPKLDQLHPATLSKAIIKDILRVELGFDGVVITDDLFMKALTAYSAREITTLCIAAGVDILLCGNPGAGVSALEKALEMKLELEQLCISQKSISEVTIKSHQRINALLLKISEIEKNSFEASCIGCKEHLALRDSLANC